MPLLNRRAFLGLGAIAGLGLGVAAVDRGLIRLPPIERRLAGLGLGRDGPRLLVRSAWQWQNIGDVAHPLGIIALLRRQFPDAMIRLWTNPLNPETRAFYEHVLPDIGLVETDDAIGERLAIARSDVLISGSSAGFSARNAVRKWLAHGGGPFGLFGITLGNASAAETALLRRARFVYFRDSQSVAYGRSLGLDPATSGFVPDDVFAYRETSGGERATAFLRSHGLADGRFLCCIPRYRWTPTQMTRGVALPPEKEAANRAHVEADHRPLRLAIERLVRERGMRVLICPEDVTQIQLGRTMLHDPLPADVRAALVWRDRFWLPDEAAAVYRRSAGVFGNDQHSAIMAVAHGVPAIVCRSVEQQSKGVMWRDLGLGDWLFDLDRPAELARLPDMMLAIAADPQAARRRARAAADRAGRLHLARMGAAARLLLPTV